MVDVITFLKRNKEGAFIGGVAGAILFKWYPNFGGNMGEIREAAMTSGGLIDKVITQVPAQDPLTAKVFLLYVIVGIAVGMAIDHMYKPTQ